MSFYTSLTGLNAATAQLSVTSNNIANVGTTGFKRSRADFGDIFATSPLQKASSVIGQGVALKSVTQEFSQGNVQFSANSLDVAITGDGFFPLKSADGLQDIYTRNGTFVLDDTFAVVNTAGQALMAATVDSSGKADLENLRKLYIPRATTGEALETTEVDLSLNLPADSPRITEPFDPLDPSTYNLTTAVTVFDSGGNSYLATVYYVKTQVASPEDPSNKWQTHVYIGENKLGEYLIQATDNSGERVFVNKYGEIRPESQIPPQDISRGVSKLYNIDDLKNPEPSTPATANGAPLRSTLVNDWKTGLTAGNLVLPKPAIDLATVGGAAAPIAGTSYKFELGTAGSSFVHTAAAGESWGDVSSAIAKKMNARDLDLRSVFRGGAPATGETYRIQVGSKNFDYQAQAGDTWSTVMTNLTALVDADADIVASFDASRYALAVSYTEGNATTFGTSFNEVSLREGPDLLVQAAAGPQVSSTAEGLLTINKDPKYGDFKVSSGEVVLAESIGGLKMSLKVDGSEQEVDLTDLMLAADRLNTPITGIEIARAITNQINKAFGDERYFDFSALAGNISGDSSRAGLFKVAVGAAGSSDQVPTTDFITVAIDPPEGGSFNRMTIEQAEAQIRSAIDREISAKQQAALAQTDPELRQLQLANVSRLEALDVSYDPVNRSFAFKAQAEEKVYLSAATNATNELLGLSANISEVDLETGLYGADVPPNGASILAAKDQRFGIKVSFDDTNSRFTVASGSTGDTSSISISKGSALVKELFGFPAGDEPAISVDTSRSPLRGIESQPAIIRGSPIGLNVAGKFSVDDTNNKFVVTVDNVTGLVEMPVRSEYTIDSFRTELERRINSLQDSQGRSVNGVKVNVERNAVGQSFFTFTTGTTGDDSFLKISSAAVWGVSGDVSARGSTSRWLNPPQASSPDGRALYVDREGLETVSSAGFDPDEALNLWSPIFLDKGELTFDTAGNLTSPKTPIRFKPETIGDTGATLEFSISYDGSTQYSTPFSVLAQGQNGRPEGDLIGLDIGDDGLVSANYSNGTQKNLAKIVLANFTAPTGLRQVGEASYLATSQSGAVTLGEAGTAGFGTIRAGARERANVDLTQELIELISAQRNFQANAKAIETNNTLTQAIINIRN
ncbi:MAG: Flagellar hook protein FlgE [Pseudomonadota bacterium]|jgi:flagellar hook-basal body protein